MSETMQRKEQSKAKQQKRIQIRLHIICISRYIEIKSNMRLCMQRKVQSSATETDTNTDTDTNALHIHIHYRLLVSETMQRQEQFKAQQYLCISFLKAFRFALL